MQNQTQRVGDITGQVNVLAIQLKLFVVSCILQNLTLHECLDRYNGVIELYQQIVRRCDGAKSRVERRPKVIDRFCRPDGLPRDRLDRRQSILDPVAEFPDQKLSMRFCGLAFADIDAGRDKLRYLPGTI